MAFPQLAGVALPCEQRLHFRCVSWRFARHSSQSQKCNDSFYNLSPTAILQFTRLPWLSIFNAASQAREQTVQRLLRFILLKNNVALPCNSQSASKMAPTMIRGLPNSSREFPTGFLGVSPLPGSFLVPRSMAGKGVSWSHLSFYGQCNLVCFVLKSVFSQKFWYFA